jgi:phosphatidylcholine synthase
MVHLYTAIGGIIGVFALILVGYGRMSDAFLLLIVTMIIDSTDGILARRVRVSEKLPYFDGASMDNVIDILTYAWIPIYIIHKLQVLPSDLLLIIPILASLYAYGQVNMKTEDSFFLGFPTYWNIVALYLYLLRPTPEIATLIIVIPGILSFIPTRYLYPSKNKYLQKTSWALCLIWFSLISILLFQDVPDKNLAVISLFFPAYYMFTSFFVDYKVRKKQKKAAVLVAAA